MYELVVVDKGKETVIFATDNELEAELRRQQHIRSLASGVAEVRKVKDK